MVRQGNFERDLGGRCDMNSVQVGYSGEQERGRGPDFQLGYLENG